MKRDELPDCDVCINESKYLDEQGRLTVYHVNMTNQHPEDWGQVSAEIAQWVANRDRAEHSYVPQPIPKPEPKEGN